MRHIARRALLVGVVAVCGCSTSSPTAPASSTPVLTTDTFMGTARATGPGSCTGDFHNFAASAGTIAVTLVQTTPAENMTVQICSTNSASDCSMTRRQINVGQTLEVPRNALTAQTLSLLPLTCGTNAPPSPTPIVYTATVRYLK